MGAIENEKIYALKLRESTDDGSDFGTPDADYRLLFVGEDGDLHLKDSADAVTDFPAGGGGGGVGSWTDWTPTITQSTLETATIVFARYVRIGDITHFRVTLTITSAGVANNAIVIGGQPADLQDADAGGGYRIIGNGVFEDSGTGVHAVSVRATGAQAWDLLKYDQFNSYGITPNIAVANNDKLSIWGSVRPA